MTDNNMDNEASLKLKTARTLKWNTIDRLASQVLYGVVGVVLANVLSQEDFGLVGALLVFQAFAIIFADSGFGAALLQQKNPTEKDYSTVFWFNLIVSVGIYVVLWVCSPLIADIFQGDRRLIPLSKVMFLTFVLNALAIVQINRLMKRMDVKMIAVSNLVGQTAGGGVGIAMALYGYGAWALVWQSVIMAGTKTGILWATGGWRPMWGIYRESLHKIWRIGFSVFSSTLLNTVFLNIYSFVIGAAYSLRSLGVYTQADKWSKMGSASLSQVLTASFVPVLSRVQDSEEDFRRYVRKINRFTGFILFPFMIGLAAVGTNLFHMLFGNMWDAAIIMFKILVIRGVFVVLVSLYGNYMLAKGYGKRLFMIEVIKDAAIAVAIVATIFEKNVDLLVWGQLWASVAAWGVIICITSRAIGYRIMQMIKDLVPFLMVALVMWGVCYGVEVAGEKVMAWYHKQNTGAKEAILSEGESAVVISLKTESDSVVGKLTEGPESEAGSLKDRSDAEVGGKMARYSDRTHDEMVVSDGQAGVEMARHSDRTHDEMAVSDGQAESVMARYAERTHDEVVVSDGQAGIEMSGRVSSGIMLLMQVIIGGGIYVMIAKLCKFPEFSEATNYLFGRFRKRRVG